MEACKSILVLAFLLFHTIGGNWAEKLDLTIDKNDLSSESVSEGKCLKNPSIFKQANFTWVFFVAIKVVSEYK